MFTFLLASFPAGLVIYWAWSNTLSLAQQYAIMKRQGAEIHLIGNISNTFKPLQRFTERTLEAVKQRTSGKATDANPAEKRPRRTDADGKDA
jgi:YidC/Oxa1 family membrane protein insertase